MTPISKRTPTLQVKDLRVRRSRSFELNIDSIWLMPGGVTCVAGANGSGKTTLIEALVGLLPAGQSVRIMGRLQTPDQTSVKTAFGFIPDDDAWIIPELTAHEYFELLRSIYQEAGAVMKHEMRWTVRELAAQLNFDAFGRQLGSLSHGNRKKVQIIAALMAEPRLLIVDELRNGLDPIAIKQAEKLLKAQAGSGVAILAATHDLWWAERFADDIIMLHQGRILLEDTTARISAEAGSVEAKFLELYGATA